MEGALARMGGNLKEENPTTGVWVQYQTSYVRFLVKKLAQSLGFLVELRIFPVSIISPNLHTHSFIYQQCYTNFTIHRVVK
jgi:hypothetical protein